MTMTESPPADVSAPAAAPPAVAGLYDVLTTTDHKRIGRLWLGSGVLLLVGATVVGLLIGIERLDAGSVDVFGGDNAYFQMWALHRFGLALLVAAPLFIGLATVVVPMQVGSTNIAFPRAALGAAWTFVLGAGIMVVSVLAGGGWGAVDRVTGDERDAIALTLVGMGMVLVALVVASITIVTTAISLRTEGMTLDRVPLFTWSMLVTGSVWILTLPVVVANLVVGYVDLHNGPGAFGGGGAEGVSANLDLFGSVTWLVEQPQIYAFAIPVLGILGSVTAVSAGVRAPRHTVSMTMIGLLGLLSVGAWSQPLYQMTGTSVDYDEKFVFVVFGIAAIVPVLGALGGAADTLVRGKDNVAGLPPAHLVAALGGGILLLAAAAGGVARVIEPFHLGGRITVSGVMHLVAVAAVTSVVAGLWFWGPKITGKELSPGLGRLAALTFIGGGLLLGGAQVINGFLETPDDPLAPLTDDVADALNVVALIGTVLVALAVLTVLGALLQSMRAPAGADDPWGGQTLEWATVTPPPPGNFAAPVAVVRSEAPLLDTDDADTDDADTDGEEG